MSSLTQGKRRRQSTHTSFEILYLDPLNYVPETKKSDIRNRIVYFVHFVAYSILESGGNHWNIFLETGKEESVRLEMIPGAFPGAEGYLGRLDIILHPYAMTRHSQKFLTIPMDRKYSVARFLDVIVQMDNHRYELTREGRGCGGWVRDQFYLFVRAGLLPSMWETQFESMIKMCWEDGTSRGPWPLTYGTYLRNRGKNQPRRKGNEGQKNNNKLSEAQ
jgi:hypothetical protein